MKMENNGWREMVEGIRSEEGERDGIKGVTIRKGAWTEEEDKKLVDHIQKHGHGSWKALPKLAGLNRCGKSCRLRWTNYLRPHLKKGNFSPNEQHTILTLHALLGNKWSTIASHLPGRTDNEIKNFWHTHLKKKLVKMGIDPVTHTPTAHHHLHSIIYLSNLLHYFHPINFNAAASNLDNFLTINYPCHNNIQVLLHSILQLLTTPCPALPTTSTNCTSPNMNMAVPDHQHRFLCNSTLDYGFSFSVPQNNVQVGHHLFHPNINSNPNNAQIATYSTPEFNIDHQLPRLVSAISPYSNIDATTSTFNIDDHCQRISDPSSPSATFEVWRNPLIDVDPTDSYWKDFME